MTRSAPSHHHICARLLCLTTGLLTLGHVVAAPPQPNVTAEQIRAALPEKLEHPYLYFSQADKPALGRRIATDPACARLYADLKAKADAYLRAETVRRPDVLALALVYQLTGDKRYAQRAFEFLPAQFEPRGGYFDLPASRTCRSLAQLYDWLYPGLTDEQRAHIRQGLMTQGIDLLRGRYADTWWTTTYRCNWNPVCNSAAGVAALALLTEDPTLTDVIAEAYNGIYRTYDEIGIDGSWCEGVNYWSYGLFVSLYFADALNRITDSQFNLLEHEHIQANPVSFALHTLIPPGPHAQPPHGSRMWKSVDFEDSGDKREDSSYGYNRLAAATDSREAAWLRQTIFKHDGGDSVFDLVWPVELGLLPGLPAVASKQFHTFGWVVMRTDFTSPQHVVLAAVCAEHWDTTREIYYLSHQHLEAGHFNLYWQGESFIADIGNAGYPKDFWTARRWDYPQTSSVSHNVVFVNGEPQVSGRGVGGRIVSFEPGEDRDYLLMDPTRAYPGKHLKRWRRHLLLDKPVITVVLDEIVAVGGEIDVRFHSEVAVEQHDTFLLLQGQSGTMALLPAATQAWQFRRGSHLLVNAKNPLDFWDPESKDRTVAYTDVHLAADRSRTNVATVILPVADADEAQVIADSLTLRDHPGGPFTVSFTLRGQELHYDFP